MRRLVGERRALAAAVLALYAFLYTLIALQPPPGWGACMAALAGVYGVAFVGVVAGYFWARWYAMGVGLSGVITGALLLWQMGPEPVALFHGGVHALAWLAMWGDGVGAAFDGRTEWRQRFHMDENATHKLGRSVIRLGVSLPYVVMYALAPRQGGGSLAAMAALALVGCGVWGVMKMRSWGLVALAGAAIAITVDLSGGVVALSAPIRSGLVFQLVPTGLTAVALLAAVVLPFMAPAVRYLRRA